MICKENRIKDKKNLGDKENHLSSTEVSDQLQSELLEQPRELAEEMQSQGANMDHNVLWPRGFLGHAHNPIATSLIGNWQPLILKVPNQEVWLKKSIHHFPKLRKRNLSQRKPMEVAPTNPSCNFGQTLSCYIL